MVSLFPGDAGRPGHRGPAVRACLPRMASLALLMLLGCAGLLLPAQAITFADAAPPQAWVSVQTAHSPACEMATANQQRLFIGQCQDQLPHGRGLLVSADKGIEGAKLDRGAVHLQVKPELLQGVEALLPRARYLHAFYRIQWTDPRLGPMPGPQDSEVVKAARQFIREWSDSDPDGLVLRAQAALQQAVQATHDQAWQQVQARGGVDELDRFLTQWRGQPQAGDLSAAQALRAQRFRQAYDQDFKDIDSSRSAQRFAQRYASEDPDKRLPRARQMQAEYEAQAQRAAEAQARAEAAKRAREAANPQCMAQRQSCLSQCAVYANDSARWRCEFVCERIRCD
jgi:hypothetical protein